MKDFTDFVPDMPSHCRPVYTAIFYLEGSVDTPEYRLEITFREAVNGDINRESMRWQRLGVGDKDLTKMVDINIVDLEQRFAFQSHHLEHRILTRFQLHEHQSDHFRRSASKCRCRGQVANEIYPVRERGYSEHKCSTSTSHRAS
jgi:hypothetical protein